MKRALVVALVVIVGGLAAALLLRHMSRDGAEPAPLSLSNYAEIPIEPLAATQQAVSPIPPTGANTVLPTAPDHGDTAAPATPDQGEPVTPAARAKLTAALALLEVNKKMEARLALTELILHTPQDSDFRSKVRGTLDELNREMFFSPTATSDSVAYKVQPNDSLWKIARDQRSSPELIMLVNRRKRDMVRPGERLKIPSGEFSVIVEKAHFRLILLFNNHYIKEYPVGLGKDDRTPVGSFVIQSGKMVKFPTWTGPDGKMYSSKDPANPLGTRWIAFEETEQHAGYGIHGTKAPESIGKQSSNGCIRMLNRDVEEVFSMLRPGENVTIR